MALDIHYIAHIGRFLGLFMSNESISNNFIPFQWFRIQSHLLIKLKEFGNCKVYDEWKSFKWSQKQESWLEEHGRMDEQYWGSIEINHGFNLNDLVFACSTTQHLECVNKSNNWSHPILGKLVYLEGCSTYVEENKSGIV